MVKLALLWHMHQPYYEDLATGEHILPWVRLHAIKDYWGMVNMLEEFPGVRLTFNLVPSLLVQVQAFADDRARDRHLQIGLKSATDLQPEEVAWLIANGFHAPYDRMIAPYPRYKELHAARHARRAFDVDALRDLQVWHKLAWMDPDLLARDTRLLGLIQQGSRYSEADKAILRDVELETIRDVIPAYRRALERGQVELSTSPFYHPILPLLCDSDVHLRAHPNAERPQMRFQRPDDAAEQIRRALDYHESLFGQRPHGMWPSEGSVSDEVVRLVKAAQASSGLPQTRTSWRGRSRSVFREIRSATPSALSCSIAPIDSAAMQRKSHACSGITSCQTESASRISHGMPRRRRSTSSNACVKPGVDSAAPPARTKGSSASSSTARTRGSTTTAAVGPS